MSILPNSSLWAGDDRVDNKVLVIAEVGVNHNGDMDIAKKLIGVAKDAGCDIVKFQKRTPLYHVPPDQWNDLRDTPWGMMTKRGYRETIEFSSKQCKEIVSYCDRVGIEWMFSVWDDNALYTVLNLGARIVKIPSACVTDLNLLKELASYEDVEIIMSTGMSTFGEVQAAMDCLGAPLGSPQIGLLVCTSAYPAPVEELHLSRIHQLASDFAYSPIGYSGHEAGLWTTLMAVGMGARIVERHITLDRTMKGSDHSASLEPDGLKRLVREIRNFELAYGSSEIKRHPIELKDFDRLRRFK